MPHSKRPVAYAADYEYAEDNAVSSWQRQYSDVILDRHLREMNPVLKLQDLTLGTKLDIPNLKKEQQAKGNKAH